MEIYTNIYNNASDSLKQYLKIGGIFQAFTGVRPVVLLGAQDSKTMEIVPPLLTGDSTLDNLFPTIQTEFQALIKQFGENNVRLETIDYTSNPNIGSLRIELINSSALRNVIEENRDMFSIQPGVDPTEWLIQNPNLWAMAPKANASYEDRYKEEVVSGLVSGYRRGACEVWAKGIASTNVDWKASIKKAVQRGHKDDKQAINYVSSPIIRKGYQEPLNTEEVSEAINESSLPQVHYSAADIKWTKDAVALKTHVSNIYGLK